MWISLFITTPRPRLWTYSKMAAIMESKVITTITIQDTFINCFSHHQNVLEDTHGTGLLLILYHIYVGDKLQAVEKNVQLTWSKDSFYPRHLRPFGPLWLPSPHNPSVFLKAKYKHFSCKSGAWDHKRERGAILHISLCQTFIFLPICKKDANCEYHYGNLGA